MLRYSKHILPIIVVTLVFLAVQSVSAEPKVLAQSETTVGNDFGVGARAMGMGGAFIGIADDFTALYWNPAGLTQIRRMEFFTGLSHEKSEIDIRYFGNSDSTFASNTRPNSLGIVIPVPVQRGGLAFALGVNRVQSFDSRMRFYGYNSYSAEQDPVYHQAQITESRDESGGMYLWSFGVGVEIAKDVSVGGSLDLLSGYYEYDRELFFDDISDAEVAPGLVGMEFRDSVYSEYLGVEGKLALLAKIGKRIRVGANIGVPLSLSVDEDWVQDSYYFYDDDTYESSLNRGYFPYDISRPFRFGFGIAACPVRGAILAADVLYSDWTQTKYSVPPVEGTSNDVFRDDYRDTLQVHLGAEYAIPDTGLRIRGGYLIDPLPYTPGGTDIDPDRRFITFGLGVIAGKVLSLDVAYMHGFWEESSNDNLIVKGTDSSRMFLSAGYRF